MALNRAFVAAIHRSTSCGNAGVGEYVDIAVKMPDARIRADVIEASLSAVALNVGAVTCISIHCCVRMELSLQYFFASNTKRFNVAVTRAKTLTIIAFFH